MATAITADDMLAALKRWSIAPKFFKPDWRTHNRNAAQGWGPLYGFIVHNFASDISDASSLAYLYNGDAGRSLPGPLSQFAITDDGQVWVIGWGTANHAGTVDSDTHALVVKDAMPRDRDVRPNTSGASASGTVKGGPRYIGVEMTYGNKGPTAAQRASCVRLAAAMAEMVGGTGGSVVGHRECTTSRSDPQFIPMGPFRRDVDALLKAGSSGTTTPTPAPQEDDMPTVDEIWNAKFESPLDPTKKYTAEQWLTMANVKAGDAKAVASKALARIAALEAVVKAIQANPDVTPEQIEAAAKAGAEAALNERISDAEVSITVAPSA